VFLQLPGCRLSGVVFDCWMLLSVVDGCRLSSADCWLSDVGSGGCSCFLDVWCQLLVVRLSVVVVDHFFVVGAQLCFPILSDHFCSCQRAKVVCDPMVCPPTDCAHPIILQVSTKKKTIQPVITTPCRNLSCTPEFKTSSVCLRPTPAFSGAEYFDSYTCTRRV
jgi:hypothetical protein